MRRALRGEKDDALQSLEAAVEKGYFNYDWFERDLAFEQLERSIDERSSNVIYLRVEPFLDPGSQAHAQQGVAAEREEVVTHADLRQSEDRAENLGQRFFDVVARSAARARAVSEEEADAFLLQAGRAGSEDRFTFVHTVMIVRGTVGRSGEAPR